MTELKRLRAVVDTFLDFMGVASGAWEECLWNTRYHVLDAFESGIHRGARVALAMAEVTVEADLTRSMASLWGRSCATMRTWLRATP
jgi:hypothetical protein